MIKKIALIFALTFVCIAVNAQLPVGGWTIHSPFGGVSSIAETKSMTFYLSVGSLFSVDKKTNEVRSLNITNDLNGGAISAIYAQPEGKYLIVTYSDCNIDRINDDGSVVNISDISDALISGKPAINHIGFGNGRIYVSTTFGLVTLDDRKNETIETMFSPLPVNFACGVDDHVVIGYNSQILAAPAAQHLVNINSFKYVGNNTNNWTLDNRTLVIGDKRLIFAHRSGNNIKAIHCSFDFVNDKLYAYTLQNNGADILTTNLAQMGADKAFITDASNIYLFDATSSTNAPEVTSFPSVLKGHTISAFNGFNNLWAGDADGICQFDITDRANPVQLGDKFGKTEFATVQCNSIAAQKSGDIYFWNKSNNANLMLGYTSNNKFSPTAYNHTNGYSNISPSNIETSANNWGSNLTGQMWMLQDPLDPEAYFVGSWTNGLYRIKNGEQTHRMTPDNSPILNEDGTRLAFITVDDNNNIIMGQEAAQTRQKNLHSINASAFQKETIPTSAWHTITLSNISRVSEGLYLQKSKMLVTTPGFWSSLIYLTPINSDGSFKTPIEVSSYIDQDNKAVSFYHTLAFCEDAKGRLWVGTDKGVFEITNPTSVTSDIAKVNHLKVPRNDGTGLADYLLDAITVTGIATDSSNRKWISTSTAGVYLVSENGDQIIEHYDTNNSILPSNSVYAVACDPNSSSVFFATANGVVEYNSTSAPASENLDNVYAYPNPVRPDYSGWITVTGLMDNTLVKIADSAGNVFFQGRSEGGMITWDGCNANGDRVKTGVYYVFASHGTSNDSGSDGCVTKIMVIN